MCMRIFLFIFSLFFLVGCTGEYNQHIQREHTPIVSSSDLRDSLSGRLLSLPDFRILEDLILSIDQAKTRIWIETYTWTEKETLEAIVRAKKRGVDIRVVLEGSVYRTPWINNDAIKKLRAADITFSYADNHRYTFTHIKTWIIDSEWCVSTGNWSYTSFMKNREFIYCSRDNSLMRDLEEIIQSDFHHVRPYFPDWLDPHIWLSPENVRPWLTAHIQNAKKNIIVYNQSITDNIILKQLQEKADEWVTIELCQAYRDDVYRDAFSGMLLKNIDIKYSKKPYLHAKVFLLDGERVILWSANMTQNALDNNREILIDLGKNKKSYDMIFSFYYKDCHSSSGK